MPGFALHALSVGDGILAIAPLPGRGGEYAADIAHLGEWRPSLVISLTTRLELVAGGADDLGADVRAKGSRWFHLPIEDFGVPSDDAMALWPEIATQALAALRGGGRVLVHCKGGCGRSGMIALRLMVMAREPADAALERLRAVRPCAVETEAQMHWAGTGRLPKA